MNKQLFLSFVQKSGILIKHFLLNSTYEIVNSNNVKTLNVYNKNFTNPLKIDLSKNSSYLFDSYSLKPSNKNRNLELEAIVNADMSMDFQFKNQGNSSKYELISLSYTYKNRTFTMS